MLFSISTAVLYLTSRYLRKELPSANPKEPGGHYWYKNFGVKIKDVEDICHRILALYKDSEKFKHVISMIKNDKTAREGDTKNSLSSKELNGSVASLPVKTEMPLKRAKTM